MARGPGKQQMPQQEDAPPAFVPDIPPPARYAQPGHDFTLQVVMQMQNTLGDMNAKFERSQGDLNAKVDRLIGDVKSLSDKVDTVRLRLAWYTGGAAVIGAIVALAVSIGLSVLRYSPTQVSQPEQGKIPQSQQTPPSSAPTR